MSSIELYYSQQAENSDAQEGEMEKLKQQCDYIYDKVMEKLNAFQLNDGQFLDAIANAEQKLTGVIGSIKNKYDDTPFDQHRISIMEAEISNLNEIDAIADQSIRKIEIEGETFVFCFAPYWSQDNAKGQREKIYKSERNLIGTLSPASKIKIIRELPEVFEKNIGELSEKETRIELKKEICYPSTLSEFSEIYLEPFFIYRNRLYHWKHKYSNAPNWIIDPNTNQEIEEMIQITVSAPFSPKVEV